MRGPYNGTAMTHSSLARKPQPRDLQVRKTDATIIRGGRQPSL